MLEKLGKFFRSLFTDGQKGIEAPAPLPPPQPLQTVGKPADEHIEATAPTKKTTTRKPKKDNVVVAPIKKEKKEAPGVEPKATKARKPRTPKPKM